MALSSLVLASKSSIRRDILVSAGISLSGVVDSEIDESVFHDDFKDDIYGLAPQLACKKGCVVSQKYMESLVIGCDQCLIFDGTLFHKSKDVGSLKDKLKCLRGKTHFLVSGVSCCLNGSVLWSYSDLGKITMRNFSDAFLDDYVACHGKEVLNCVGGYQLENKGSQLLSSVEGDYFTILGLPLLPLLHYLRLYGFLQQ